MTESDSGDYIGQNKSWDFSSNNNAKVSVTGASNSTVVFRAEDFDISYMTFEFGSETGKTIVPGLYTPAKRYPFRGSFNGIDISGDGRGCNTILGAFKAKLYGSIRYGSDIPDSCNDQGCAVAKENLGFTETQEKPDLIIKDVILPTAENKKFTVEVKNNGSVATSFSDGIKVSASVRDSNQSLVALKDSGFYYIDNLEPDTSKSTTFNITGEISGNIELTIWIDNAENGDGGFIDESNEDNNILTKTITISSSSDDTPPSSIQISNLKITNITDMSATISWDSNNPVNNIYYFRIKGDNNWTKSGGIYQTTTHSATMYNLSPGTSYEYYIDIEDNSGNKFQSNVAEFKTEKNNSFKITDPLVTNITSNSVIIKWTSDNEDISSVLYGTENSQNGINRVAKDNALTINHSLIISNLIANTKYYFKVLSNSLSDNLVESAVFNFITKNKENNTDSNTDNTNKIVSKLQRQISALEKQVIKLEKKLTKLDQKFAERYAGTMFLDVENHGRLWYVDPASKNRFYFENGEAALNIGSRLAIGITYEDIQKIPVGVPDKLYNLSDSDSDGLPDRLEAALGSDPNNSDTDGDGYSDKQELNNGYNPGNNEKYYYDQKLINRLEGKMLLQVSGPNSHGEIWYIKDGQKWYGGTEDSMYEIMKARSLGAKPSDIRKIGVGNIK